MTLAVTEVQPHRQGWTYQGLSLPSHTDRVGHIKVFHYPATQTGLDIPRPLITQSWTTLGGGGVKVLRQEADSNCQPVGPQSNTPTTRPRGPPQVRESNIPRVVNRGDRLRTCACAVRCVHVVSDIGENEAQRKSSYSTLTCSGAMEALQLPRPLMACFGCT